MPKKSFIRTTLASLIALLITIFANIAPAYAEESVAISPMYQNMVLVPGRKTQGTFIVYSPGSSKETNEIEITIRPFWQDENNDVDLVSKDDYSQIVNWVTIDKTSYTLEPNESEEVTFTIDVPEDAPAGGQYLAFVAQNQSKSGNYMITQVFQMAHLVYAEVAGQTTRGGDISGLQLPSFLFSGDITAGATVKNTGNVHSKVTHTLKIKPLFGDEEFFTNEEAPAENIIMPGATRYTAVTWNETPSMGIFRAEYTVEFEGVKKELSKIVIVCPIWLLAIIVAIIVVLIYSLLSRKRSRRDTRPETA